MARPLSYSLDKRMEHPTRSPAYKVFLYDLRSTSDTIGYVVRDLALDPLTGPLEVTANVLSVEVEEIAGDFIGSGIPRSLVTLTVVDDTPGSAVSRWDPQFSADDSSAPARFLRRGNGIRIQEGDAQVPEEDWPFTFTGVLIGQAGVDRGRAAGAQGRSLITMQAVSRDAEYIRQIRTSDRFDRGASYLTMGTEVATNVMALDADEIDFSGWGSHATGLPIQFAKTSPIVAIAQLMFLDGYLPRFDGEGRLTQTSGEVSKSPARIYPTLSTIRHISRPFSSLDPVNSVEVIGISGTKEKVVQQKQPLAQVSVTTGYFTSDEEIRVYWSDDRTALAENIKLEIEKSVNGGLSALGGGETWSLILAPNQASISIGAILKLDTGFSPYVIVFLSVVYIVLAVIPDVVVSLFGGVTISVGRLLQAVALAAILILMTKIGRGQYQFLGDPVEFVFKEVRGLAEIDGLTTEELHPETIENHLVQTQPDADSTSRVTLFRQQAKGNPRLISALHDLRLEPDDVFEIPGGRRFLIERISRRLERGAPEVPAAYSTFEVTPGLLP